MIRVQRCLAKEKKVGLSRAEKGAAVLWRGKPRYLRTRGNGDWRHWGRTVDRLVPCWRGTCRGKPRRSATHSTAGPGSSRRHGGGMPEAGASEGRSGGVVHGWVGGSWDENGQAGLGTNLFLLPTWIASRPIPTVRRARSHVLGDGIQAFAGQEITSRLACYFHIRPVFARHPVPSEYADPIRA